MDWVVPWTTAEVIDFIFLLVATSIVTAVPVVYGVKANLRDGLARAVVAGTGATAFAFLVTVGFTVAIHAGWHPPDTTRHWLARLIYTAVALGKLLLLIALMQVLRETREALVRGRVMDARQVTADARECDADVRESNADEREAQADTRQAVADVRDVNADARDAAVNE